MAHGFLKMRMVALLTVPIFYPVFLRHLILMPLHLALLFMIMVPNPVGLRSPRDL